MKTSTIWKFAGVLILVFILGAGFVPYNNTQEFNYDFRTKDGAVSKIKVKVMYRERYINFFNIPNGSNLPPAVKRCMHKTVIDFFVTDLYKMQKNNDFSALNEKGKSCLEDWFEKFPSSTLYWVQVDEVIFDKKLEKRLRDPKELEKEIVEVRSAAINLENEVLENTNGKTPGKFYLTKDKREKELVDIGEVMSRSLPGDVVASVDAKIEFVGVGQFFHLVVKKTPLDSTNSKKSASSFFGDQITFPKEDGQIGFIITKKSIVTVKIL